jgi:hypothetical protein
VDNSKRPNPSITPQDKGLVGQEDNGDAKEDLAEEGMEAKIAFPSFNIVNSCPIKRTHAGQARDELF